MRQSLKKFILSLPGPKSYCHCESVCSNIEIEHVLPKSILKKTLIRKTFKEANRDPHNLYTCCSKLNRDKALLLGQNYVAYDFSGMLGRSCLYMNYAYGLNIKDRIVNTWNNFSLLYPPLPFEYERAKIIYLKTGKRNTFIDMYKTDNGTYEHY